MRSSMLENRKSFKTFFFFFCALLPASLCAFTSVRPLSLYSYLTFIHIRAYSNFLTPTQLSKMNSPIKPSSSFSTLLSYLHKSIQVKSCMSFEHFNPASVFTKEKNIGPVDDDNEDNDDDEGIASESKYWERQRGKASDMNTSAQNTSILLFQRMAYIHTTSFTLFSKTLNGI